MDYMQALARMQQLRAEIAERQVEERDLRSKLFAGTFPQPSEGVNNYPLPNGNVVKGTYRINRTLLEPEWAKLNAAQLSQLLDSGAFKHKPTLVLAKYRELSGATLALADMVLEIKPGLPDLEVVTPKE